MGEVTGSEKAILFSGPMVKAILDGRKSQTRRVLRPQPFLNDSEGEKWWFLDRSEDGYGKTNGAWKDGDSAYWTYCPYGQPGTKLWVRETWAAFDETAIRDRERNFVFYRADDEKKYETDGKWRPSIFMPRWASRITLEITKVRVERVQEISEEDAEAEGIRRYRREFGQEGGFPEGWEDSRPGYGGSVWIPSAFKDAYRNLWDAINSKRGCGWDTNPWVWVIEFKRFPL
jgi:hypothetical protein